MGLVLIDPPNLEPIDVESAKTHLRVDGAEEDDLIAELVTAARQYVEHATGRALLQQRWRRTLDAFPGDNRPIQLSPSPLISVESVQYVDGAGVPQTLAPAEYIVDTSATLGAIAPAHGVSWPAARAQRNAVTIEFTVGYGAAAVDVPRSLRAAILLWLGDLYRNREASITGTIITANPAVTALLSPYLTTHVV